MLASTGLIWQASSAAFTSTTDSVGNAWTAGTVTLTNTTSGSAVFSSANMEPGQTVFKCINVTYAGAVQTEQVRFYTTTTTDEAVIGGTLGTYYSVQIQEGTSSTDSDCTSFSATSTIFDSTHNQTGTPTGTKPIGTMADLTQSRTDYSNAILSPWAPNAASSRSYRFTITFVGSNPEVHATDNSMKGKQIITTFNWEARSR